MKILLFIINAPCFHRCQIFVCSHIYNTDKKQTAVIEKSYIL